MNNNKQCPICRSPLASANCKKCGYTQKKLKIVETQEEFGRFNYMSKIQRGQQSHKTAKRLTAEEKLTVYLRQYIKLLKAAVNKVSTAHGLPLQQVKMLDQQVFQVWKGYLVGRRERNLSLAGMFKKSTFAKAKYTPKKKAVAEESEPQGKSQKDLDSSQEEKKEDKKRKATSVALEEQNIQDQSSLDAKHKFRSYFFVTVKPLIHSSVQQRKMDKNAITSCQKSFLSYLLAVQETDEELVLLVSKKYVKMLLQINGQVESAFVKDIDVERQLKKRNSGVFKKKEESIMLILVIDLLFCLNSETVKIVEGQKLKELLQIYQRCQRKSEVVEKILEFFNKDATNQSPNIPQINYELIYTIINLAANKIGLCLAIPEIIVGCGKLEINSIAINDETSIVGVPNEESISTVKIRKSTHLLASFLNEEASIFVHKWSQKWCSKLGLKRQANKVSLINQLLFKELALSEQKSGPRGEFFSLGKVIKYQRHLWLEQDIACLAGIFVFLKLSSGLIDYPYLIHFPSQEVTKHYEIKNEDIAVLSQLTQKREVTLQNKENRTLTRMIMPEYYQQCINLIDLSKHIINLSSKDTCFNSYSFNKGSIRFRNLSHLNAVTTAQLIEKIAYIKESQAQTHTPKEYEAQLKFDQHSHKQFIREIAQKNKRLKLKKGKATQQKQRRKLNQNLLRQLQCIVKQKEVLSSGSPAFTQECVVDIPCSNYQMMYEYSQDNLKQAGRHEQLYFMELLCLNLCTFSEMANWLNRLESVLKQFQLE